jgi:integrase/recombinase XerD
MKTRRQPKRHLKVWRGNGDRSAPRLDHPLMDHVDSYVEWRRTRAASESTVRTLDKALRRFIMWCDVRGLNDPRELTRAVLEAYQRGVYLERKRDGAPLSVRTQLGRLHALIGWCRWLSRERLIEYNVAADLVLPRMPHTLPKVVPDVRQIARLLAQPDLEGITGVRDRAMLEVLYSTGMRGMELCRLALADLDLERGTVWVRQGKGRRDRYIAIGERACGWVRRYLDEVRPKLVVHLDEWSLFLTDYGQAYVPHRLGNMVRLYMRHAGLMEGASHALRHACATHMLENGADIRFIQAQLGHVQLSTTQIYTQVAIGKLKAIHEATHPARRGELVRLDKAGAQAGRETEEPERMLLLAELEDEAQQEIQQDESE